MQISVVYVTFNELAIPLVIDEIYTVLDSLKLQVSKITLYASTTFMSMNYIISDHDCIIVDYNRII
jgi:hypothetical protein